MRSARPVSPSVPALGPSSSPLADGDVATPCDGQPNPELDAMLAEVARLSEPFSDG